MKNNKVQIKEKYVGGEDEGFVFDDETRKEKEKKLQKELEIKKKLEESYLTMDQEKISKLNEHASMNKLMINYWKTGQVSSALDIHNKCYASSKPQRSVISEFYNTNDNPEEFN